MLKFLSVCSDNESSVAQRLFASTNEFFLISCVSFFCLPDWLTAKIE